MKMAGCLCRRYAANDPAPPLAMPDGRISEGHVTRSGPHKAIKSIARRKLSFDERTVLHRVDRWKRESFLENLLIRIHLNHRDDFSRPALRHESLNSLFQVALHLPPRPCAKVYKPVKFTNPSTKFVPRMRDVGLRIPPGGVRGFRSHRF